MMRKTEISRKTQETDIQLTLNLDGTGQYDIQTGIGFLDHMLSLFAFHAGFDLTLHAKGDLEVDDHHTVEDIGIVLGQAFRKVFGDKKGINRYGFFLLPMDEVLARAVVDISGRYFLYFQAQFKREKIGDLATENVKEFFQAFVRESGATLHLEILTFGNDHHQAEALFKSFGRALKSAVQITGSKQIPSTKGEL